jgi:hypothetical protein
MAESNPEDPGRGEKPGRPAAKAAAAKLKPDSGKKDNTSEQQPPSSQDGTLMPATLFNLMIAEQYIDETRFPAEHKLVCFHYGVALLAAHRNDPVKRGLAAQYLAAAAGWVAGDDRNEEFSNGIDRIVCESHYNLGVIEELDGHYPDAEKHYGRAIRIVSNHETSSDAPNAHQLGIFDNVGIVAQLGKISCNLKILEKARLPARESAGAQPERKAEKAEKAVPATPEEQERRVRMAREDIRTLKKVVKALRDRVHEKQSAPAPSSAAAGRPRSGMRLNFLRWGTAESASSSDRKALLESAEVALRRQEILHAIESKLHEFESKLNEMFPPAADEEP